MKIAKGALEISFKTLKKTARRNLLMRKELRGTRATKKGSRKWISSDKVE